LRELCHFSAVGDGRGTDSLCCDPREFPLTNPQVAQGWQIFVEELQKSGWIEGRNVVFDDRTAGGGAEPYRELAAELVALNPTVILAINSGAVEALRDHPPGSRPPRPKTQPAAAHSLVVISLASL
jgi:hypothetical protein